MKGLEYIFKYKITNSVIKAKVYYKENEIVTEIDEELGKNLFSVLVGKGYIDINVKKENNQVIEFCGYTESNWWKYENLQLPLSFKGEVYLYTNFSNNLNDLGDGQDFPELWDIYYDKENKIWCMGNTELEENDVAIEICTNQIIVINNERLKSIWIKNFDVQLPEYKATRKYGILNFSKNKKG